MYIGSSNRAAVPIAADAPSEMGAFINVHSMILNDAMLVQETIDLDPHAPLQRGVGATQQLERLSRHFDDIEDEYLRERKADIEQVVERVLKALAGASATLVDGVHGACDEMIVVAHDIALSRHDAVQDADVSGFRHGSAAARRTRRSSRAARHSGPR